MLAPPRVLTRARAALAAILLSTSLSGGLLLPAGRPAPVYAQTPATDEAAQTARAFNEQPPPDQGDTASTSRERATADGSSAAAQAAGADGGPASQATAPGSLLAASLGVATPLAGDDWTAAALWYSQQWQQARALAMAHQWQAAQAALAAWRQSVLAASLLAQQAAAPTAVPRPAAPPTPVPPPNDRVRIQQSLPLDGDGLCGLAAGHVCQVGGDLAGSTVTPLGGAGATAGSQWRVVVPAGRIVAGATATVFVPTTRGIEFFDCPPATAGAQTICTGQTRGHALQRGTVRVHVGNVVVAQGPVSGPGASIQKLLIVVPGIDGTQSSSLYDPYQRASSFFGPAVCSQFNPCTSLFTALGCPAQSGAPSTTLVPCGNSGLAWLPYSYEGVAGNGSTGIPVLYTGADTGQPLTLSSAAMGQIVALGRTLLGQSAGSTSIVLVGHSLGGAVSSFWAGANSPTTPVITLDSPVNGIWPTDDALFDTYCFRSTGLLDTYNLSEILCRALADLPALNSTVVPNLQAAANIAVMGQANAVNFANPADLIVPSWYAVNRQAPHGAVLSAFNCGSLDLNHSCILGYQPAITAAAAIIQSGTYPIPMPTRATINLNVTVTLDGSPAANVPITVTQGSTPTCTTDCNPPSVTVATTTTNNQGAATVSVPWRDSLVTANVGTLLGSNCRFGALPANNTDLAFTIRAVSVVGCDVPAAPARGR